MHKIYFYAEAGIFVCKNGNLQNLEIAKSAKNSLFEHLPRKKEIN